MADIWTGTDDVERAGLTISAFVRLLRRRIVLIAAWTGLCIAVAAGLVHAMTPEYTATAEFVLTPRVFADDGPELTRQYHQMDLDLRQIETQIEIVRSARVLTNVFESLDLAGAADTDPEHDRLAARFFRRWHGLWTGQARVDDPLARFRRFADRVRIRRLGLSYVIDVSYRSLDPERAARVANAIVSAYAAERIQRGGLPQGVTPYLEQRLHQVAAKTGVAQAAMKAGTVADADIPEADLRTLGPAMLRPDSRFPRPGPTIVVAATMALVGALMVMMLAIRSDDRIHSQRQLFLRLGITCLAVGYWRQTEAWALARAVLAGLSARGWLDGPVRLAVLDLANGRMGDILAKQLAETLRNAGLTRDAASSPSDGVSKDADRPLRDDVSVVEVPSLPSRLGRRAPDFDAVVLIVTAGSTTVAALQECLRGCRKAQINRVGVVLAAREDMPRQLAS